MEENNNITISENKLLGKTFFWMFLGLLGSAIIASYTYYSGLYEILLSNNSFTALLIIEIVAVVLFTFLFRKMSPIVCGILYFVYAMINRNYSFCCIRCF